MAKVVRQAVIDLFLVDSEASILGQVTLYCRFSEGSYL